MTTDQPNLQDIFDDIKEFERRTLDRWIDPQEAEQLIAEHEQQAIDAIYAALLAVIGEDVEPNGGFEPLNQAIIAQNVLKRGQRQALKRWCYGENVSNE